MDMQASITPELTADAPMVKPRKKQRAVLFSLLGLAVAAASGGAVEYWKLIGSRYVSTDDAYTAAEVAQVASETEGSVMQVNVVDSQNVRRG
ncbi:MAG TPA: EmrA/EmrK family multidrug efflux transporter periplasmic adaptor subunit, partial [Thermoanaerobaculia bacterium]|nr:EmrA/EmrK family multidrug efflux transporter periplasmic adaptor subunit [Thermoanaerobaculia bacterium]